MFLVIDECCGKSLVRVAETCGHTAQRSIHVQGLGKGASDMDILGFALRNGAIIVTNNRTDFLALAAASNDHLGIILVPNVVGSELARLFRQVLPIADKVFRAGSNTFVEIGSNGRIRSFKLF